MKINRLIKMWVIVNLALLCVVPILFVLGLMYSKYFSMIFSFAAILIPILWLHLFYQGLYIGGLVALITLGILILQIWTSIKEHQSVSTSLITGEILIILFGLLDIIPISADIIGKLYYMIPGW